MGVRAPRRVQQVSDRGLLVSDQAGPRYIEV